MLNVPVLAVTKKGNAIVFNSLRAASRQLSGDGSDSLRREITDRVFEGGGFVGETWVQHSMLPSVTRPRS